jgi:hypothetical protein
LQAFYQLFFRGPEMAEDQGVRGVMLRLRGETHEKLRDAVRISSHRSMSALADDLLSDALDELIEARASSVDRLIRGAQ